MIASAVRGHQSVRQGFHRPGGGARAQPPHDWIESVSLAIAYSPYSRLPRSTGVRAPREVTAERDLSVSPRAVGAHPCSEREFGKDSPGSLSQERVNGPYVNRRKGFCGNGLLFLYGAGSKPGKFSRKNLTGYSSPATIGKDRWEKSTGCSWQACKGRRVTRSNNRTNIHGLFLLGTANAR